MSKIKSANTKPELIVRKYLFNKGFRYRIHDKKLPGCPDLVFKRYKIAIQVNGCFWHGHFTNNCIFSRIPKANSNFWRQKIEMNASRDKSNAKKLKKMGWTLIVVWECDLKKDSEKTLKRLWEKLVSLTKN